MRLCVAINPNSATGRSAQYQERLRTVLNEYPVEVTWVLATSQHHSVKEMREAVQRGDIDALIVAGGDGTVHSAVNALGDTRVPLGIIATGSGNDIAREFRFPSHALEDSLHQIMGALFARRWRDVDVMEISTKTETHRALAVVSVGLDADVNVRTNRLSWPSGNLRYLRGIVQGLREYSPYGASLVIDGKRASGSLTIASIANTRYFGGGFCIAPAARPDDGLLNVVIIRGLSLGEFGSLLPKLVARTHLRDPRAHEIRAREIVISDSLFHGARLPMIMADGEEICHAPATVRVVPHALRLLI